MGRSGRQRLHDVQADVIGQVELGEDAQELAADNVTAKRFRMETILQMTILFKKYLFRGSRHLKELLNPPSGVRVQRKCNLDNLLFTELDD